MHREPGEWDEHAHLSPLNDVFSWASSAPYGTQPSGSHGQWLRTDLWLMDIDGSNQRRVTFFNEAEQVIVADNDWNPAATDNPQLALSVFMRDRNETHVKIIEFAVAGRPYWPSFGYDRANTGHSPHPGPQTACSQCLDSADECYEFESHRSGEPASHHFLSVLSSTSSVYVAPMLR